MVSSIGGALPIAQGMVQRLKQFCHEQDVPMDCFVEDHSLGAANLILFSGRRTFVGKYALVGDFGYSFKHFFVGKALADRGINVEYMRKGENKAKPSPFDEPSEKDKAV